LLARSRQTTSADDVAAATSEFRQELQIDPASGNAAYELAELDRNAGQLEDAQKLFELAVKYYPDFEEAHLGLASVLASLQKPDLAIAHLQKAISLNRENEVSWYRLSQVEGQRGNSAEQQKAMAEFQRLHSQMSRQQESAKKLFTSDEVTKQQLDPAAPKSQ
jgi:predicted Zn-dependent protease